MSRRLLCLVVAAGLLAAAACTDPPPPISVGEGMVTVLNQTDHDWTDVLVTVNDHFRASVSVLKAEGRATAPLHHFTTGHGQRWAAGTPVRTVDVTGKSSDGTDVKLTYGREGR